MVPGGGAAGTTPTPRTARFLTPLPRSRRFRRIAIVRNAIVSNSIARPEERNGERERAERGNGTTGGDPPTNRRNHRATAASLPEKKLLEDAKDDRRPRARLPRIPRVRTQAMENIAVAARLADHVKETKLERVSSLSTIRRHPYSRYI